MFDVAPTELLVLAIIALVVIGPKDLPRAMRFVGNWVGKARGMARHFRSGIDTMMREAEMEDLQKQWRDQNDAIMREFPRVDGAPPHPIPLNGPDAGADGATGNADAATETHRIPPPSDELP